MGYGMNDLIPVVARLAEKYVGGDSTSVTYEKAEQLMEAVLYCIHEAETCGSNPVVSTKETPAQEVYEAGVACAKEKVKAALNLYHEILPEFVSFGNQCLEDTFIKGIPRFFKWYDVEFEPQNTIITLDYPALKDLSGMTGIDKIYEFLKCILQEQRFLKGFPENYVGRILEKYKNIYEKMTGNPCEVVFMSVAEHILMGKPLSEEETGEEDWLELKRIFRQEDLQAVNMRLKTETEIFIQKYYDNCRELSEYLTGFIGEITARLKYAADSGGIVVEKP